jgi:hypothetical protein
MPAATLFMTRGREALHTGTCREPFVADLRRGGEVLGDHGQAIVGVAEQTLCLQDVRDVGIPPASILRSMSSGRKILPQYGAIPLKVESTFHPYAPNLLRSPARSEER